MTAQSNDATPTLVLGSGDQEDTVSRDHAPASGSALERGQSHTPGPWAVEEGKSALWVGYPKAWTRKVSEVVCTFEVGSAITDAANARRRADARLIAAAPVLLEAVREALGVLEIAEAYGLYEPGSLGEVDVRDCRQQLRRAHHDATGRWMTPVEADLGGSEDLFATEYVISKATGAGQ